MTFSYDSIGQVCVTAKNPDGEAVGTLCKFTANAQIQACADGDDINGLIVTGRGKIATVTVGGFVTVPYSGSLPTPGYCALAAAGNKKVKVLSGAREYLVVYTDPVAATVTFML